MSSSSNVDVKHKLFCFRKESSTQALNPDFLEDSQKLFRSYLNFQLNLPLSIP